MATREVEGLLDLQLDAGDPARGSPPLVLLRREKPLPLRHVRRASPPCRTPHVRVWALRGPAQRPPPSTAGPGRRAPPPHPSASSARRSIHAAQPRGRHERFPPSRLLCTISCRRQTLRRRRRPRCSEDDRSEGAHVDDWRTPKAAASCGVGSEFFRRCGSVSGSVLTDIFGGRQGSGGGWSGDRLRPPVMEVSGGAVEIDSRAQRRSPYSLLARAIDEQQGLVSEVASGPRRAPPRPLTWSTPYGLSAQTAALGG
ncbi:uncharacterized protein A4U43_C01F740 [Asparagus officinalis]|uniref:Uncharacterized protein n=1 Tax=Asparagus officinalis TaxID=4686 RepID=A0A5P1FLC5_ASPOF|nr:uncharacterized protein A4U43_C01F740 [Asparagus officinalis]